MFNLHDIPLGYRLTAEVSEICFRKYNKSSLKGLPPGTVNLGIVRLEHPTEIHGPLPVPPVPVVSQPEGNRESAVDRDSQNFTENKRKMEQIAPIIQKPMNPAVSLNFIFRAEQVL